MGVMLRNISYLIRRILFLPYLPLPVSISPQPNFNVVDLAGRTVAEYVLHVDLGADAGEDTALRSIAVAY